MVSKTRTIRLTDQQLLALDALARKLKIQGQRGTTFQALVCHIADTSSAALAETAAALEIAAGCASGGDWHELTEAIEPDWSKE